VRIAAFPYFCCPVLLSISPSESSSSPDLVSELDVRHREGMPRRRQMILSLRLVRYRFSIALWPLFRDWHSANGISSSVDVFLFRYFRVLVSDSSGSGEGEGDDWESVDSVGVGLAFTAGVVRYGIAIS
jgi:hypothetical protein